jgi:hypothetical protein
MIAELIPAWTADAIHFRMVKGTLCGNQLPKVKADQVWACLVFRKVAVANAPWWNHRDCCMKAFKHKIKAFKSRFDFPERYIKTCVSSKLIQRRAFKEYNIKIKKQLDEMSSADRNFWSLIKDLTGLSTSKSNAAPSVEDLADRFATKMSNGKGEEDDDFTPNNDDCIPLSSFRIRHKDVLKSLKKLDLHKSTNGLGPRFLKDCASVLAPAITRFFRLIVRKSSYVSKWKIQRVSPVHKRGKRSLPKMYTPPTCSPLTHMCNLPKQVRGELAFGNDAGELGASPK